MFRFLFVLLGLLWASDGLDNGLARTPPMGWLTWERFRCITDCVNYPKECISEDLIIRTIDTLVNDGYRDAGYEYVGIDDCWSRKTRDENEKLVADPDRFPSGIKFLSDYAHDNGLKLGIYGDYGTYTCGGYPGSLNHMEIDAKTFAEWEVDYIKLDGCYSDISTMDEGYPEFGRYLNATGRPILYSCSWPVYQEFSGIEPNFTKISEHCNLWRNYGDIDDSWAALNSIMNYFGRNDHRIGHHAAPGHWNDPDMLIIGNFGLSYDQSKVQMAVWAILAAPLLMSVDLDTIKPEMRDILLNEDIIAINQDPLGMQGKLVNVSKLKFELWTRQVTPVVGSDYSYAVAIVSKRTDGYALMGRYNLLEMGLDSASGYIMEDLFNEDEAPREMPYNATFNVKVNPLGVAFYKFTPILEENKKISSKY